jgi:hypothetical protein
MAGESKPAPHFWSRQLRCSRIACFCSSLSRVRRGDWLVGSFFFRLLIHGGGPAKGAPECLWRFLREPGARADAVATESREGQSTTYLRYVASPKYSVAPFPPKLHRKKNRGRRIGRAGFKLPDPNSPVCDQAKDAPSWGGFSLLITSPVRLAVPSLYSCLGSYRPSPSLARWHSQKPLSTRSKQKVVV